MMLSGFFHVSWWARKVSGEMVNTDDFFFEDTDEEQTCHQATVEAAFNGGAMTSVAGVLLNLIIKQIPAR